MFYDDAPSLQTIDELAERFISHVKNRFNIDLDYSENTLSVLDHFISSVILEESENEKLPAGHPKRVHLVHLLAPSIGAYFGQVLTRSFPCSWSVFSESPMEWLIEFDQVSLRLNPAGAVAEAIIEQPIDTWHGAVATSLEETEALCERLLAAPPVPEDEFFSIATRFEVLQIAYDWMLARKRESLISKDEL